MFNIDSTGTIRITKGEDSGDFNLTLFEDKSYGHEKCWVTLPIEIGRHPDHLYIYLDKELFKTKVEGLSGCYHFEYTYQIEDVSPDPEHPQWEKRENIGWYLSESLEGAGTKSVDLARYGITCKGAPRYGDIIIINFFEYDITEVAFKILNLYTSEVKVEKKFSTATGAEPLIVDYGDVVLNLTAQDLNILDKGEYRYQVFLNLYDRYNSDSLALTKILPFYIL